MDKKLEKVKAFVKEHKVEIACAVGAAVVGGIIFAVAKRKLLVVKKSTEKYLAPEHCKVPEELLKYGVDAVDIYKGAVELMADNYDVAVAELGKFGEALCKIPDIKPENKAFVLINIAKEIDNN